MKYIIFRHIIIISLIVLIQNVEAQPYEAPSDIPRFRSFLSGCKLQVPTSSTAATSATLMDGYSSNQFFVVEGDKIAFNQSGQSNRTELRHETNWNLTEGDRSFHGRLKFVEQTCDQVTVVQIHDDANAGSGPNKPLLRIYKHLTKSPANHLWAAIKTDVVGVNTTHVDLGLAPTDYFDWEVLLENGELIINIEGVEKAREDVSFWTFPSYWKAGVYLQNDGEATVYFDKLYLDGQEVLSAVDDLSAKIKVYPNPADSFSTLDIRDSFLHGILTLYNVSGQIQYESIITSQKISLKMPENSGLYLLKIEKDGISKTVRVIKR